MTWIILYILGAISGWLLLYYTIKAAVKNAIIAARNEVAPLVHTQATQSKPENPLTEKQKGLQQRYNKGEITFADYQSEWNK